MPKQTPKITETGVVVPYLGELEIGSDSINLDAILGRDFDIIEASEKLPGIMEWVNINLQKCLEKRILLARQAKEIEAITWLDYKQGKFADDYPAISITDKAVDKASMIVPEVREAHANLAKYAAWVDRLQNLQISLQMKYDLVRSSEATRRRVFDEPDAVPERAPRARRRILTEEDDD